MTQSGYAKVLPKLRIAKEKLAKTDDIRSLALLESFEEAIRDVSELRILKGEKIEGGLKDVEKALNTIVVRQALNISKISPEPADRVAKAYLCTYVIADLLSLIKRNAVNAPLNFESLVTISIPGTPLYGLEEEAVDNPRQLVGKIKTPEARVFIERVLEAYQKTNDPGVFDLFQPLIRPYLIQAALKGLDRQSKETVESVVCPGIIFTLVSGLLYASRTKLPTEIVNIVYSGFNLCGFNWSMIRQLYENSSNDPEQLFSELKRRFSIFEGKNYTEALKEARSKSIKDSRRKALSLFAGYPFHAGLIAATLELLEHEMRDIRAVVAGKLYKVFPEKIYTVISREL